MNIETVERIMSEKKSRLPLLRNQDWKTVTAETEKIKELLTHISTNNIMVLNELISTRAKLVEEKENEQKIKTWIGNWTGDADNKCTTRIKNEKTEEEYWNMLERKEKKKRNTYKRNITTLGNKAESTRESKTKKTSRQDKTIQKNRTYKNNEKILPECRGIMQGDIPMTGWQGNNNFGAKYGNKDNITEKPNG